MRHDRKFSLRSLYFTSMLFGMVETYITKVVWEPYWHPNIFMIANIAVFETIVVVFFAYGFFFSDPAFYR